MWFTASVVCWLVANELNSFIQGLIVLSHQLFSIKSCSNQTGRWVVFFKTDFYLWWTVHTLTNPSACRQSWRSCPRLWRMYFCCQTQKPVGRIDTYYTFCCAGKEENRLHQFRIDIPWYHWTLHSQCSCRHLQLHHHSAQGQWRDLWQ